MPSRSHESWTEFFLGEILGGDFHLDKLSFEELVRRGDLDLAGRAFVTLTEIENSHSLIAATSRADQEPLGVFIREPARPVSKDVLAFIFVPADSATNSS